MTFSGLKMILFWSFFKVFSLFQNFIFQLTYLISLIGTRYRILNINTIYYKNKHTKIHFLSTIFLKFHLKEQVNLLKISYKQEPALTTVPAQHTLCSGLKSVKCPKLPLQHSLFTGAVGSTHWEVSKFVFKVGSVLTAWTNSWSHSQNDRSADPIRLSKMKFLKELYRVL